jgi:pyridine nucleotide-disulfide oxidoreductase family protein
MSQRLLLAGAGHAHLEVLHAFARRRPPGLRAALISPHPALLYSGMVPGVIGGHYRAEAVAIPIARIAAAAGIELLPTSLVALDALARTVSCADGITRHYELLSLDTGAVVDVDAIDGAKEHGHFVRPMATFVGEAERLIERARTQVLSIAVVGGGAAGFELALAVRHRLGEQVHVSLVAGASLLGGYSSVVVARGRKTLQRRGVAIIEEECVRIDAEHVVLKSGARLRCDAAWITSGTAAPEWLAASGLALDERGFAATGPTLQSRSHANVFAAGDLASRSDAPQPKSGVHAVRAGAALARNLRRVLAGEAPLPYQPPRRTLNLLSCGSRDAIASWGDWSAQGAWVWRWKDRIDRRYVARHR